MRTFPSGRVPVGQAIVLALSLGCLLALSILQQGRQGASFDSYSSYDSNAGGFRAWYELLSREGVRVGRFEERPVFLDRNVGLLIVAEPPASPPDFSDSTQADGTALATWVASGGELLLVGNSAFGVVAAKGLRLPRSEVRSPQRAAAPGEVSPALRRFGVRAVAPPDVVRLVARKGDRVLLRDRRGAVVVEYSLGRGSVVVVVDPQMFRNANVGVPDRARLAYALVALHGASKSAVAFDEAIHGHVTPEHWWQIFPRSFVAAVALASCVLAVALAGAALRLGPARPAEMERAPHTGEYLDALATLMERGHAAQACVDQALLSTRRLVATRLGVPDDLPASSIAARMRRPELGRAFVELDMLAARGVYTEAALVNGLGLAYLLRKEYSADVRGR